MQLGPLAALALIVLQPSADSVLAGRVAAYLNRVGAAGFNGAVLVAQGDSVLARGAWGLADRGTGRRMAPGTAFDVGSLSMPFTAAAVVLLEAARRLSVADSIGRFFPEAPPEKAGITIHQLLTHTAGLEADDGLGDFVEASRDEVVSRILSTRLAGRPGVRYRFSRAGYVLLAAIVERASGVPFQRLVAANLFERAGLRATGFRGDTLLRSVPVAIGYGNGADRGSPADWPASWSRLGAAGVVSTADDLFRFMRELLAARILSQGQLEQVFAPQVDAGGGGSFYGYGWALADSPLGHRIGHNGAGPGGSADLAYYPGRDLLVVVLSNQMAVRTVLGAPFSVRLPATELSLQLARNIASGDFGPLPSPTLSPVRSIGVSLVAFLVAAAVAWGLLRALGRRNRRHVE